MQPLFNPHMLLSEHFSLSEMLASETAEKHHIPNTPLKRHITALQNLAVRGEAADITIPRRHWPFCYTSSEQIARLLFTWMKDNVDLDQLILEHSGLSWWVHVSCRINYRRNRHQAFKLEKK